MELKTFKVEQRGAGGIFWSQKPLKMAENVKIIEKDVAANGHD